MMMVFSLLASLGLTWALRRYALARQVMDIPNARSAHAVPTPRGGGMAVVFCFLVALPTFVTVVGGDWPAVMALCGGGCLVAAVGFWDDHRPLAPGLRLLAHFASAIWVLAWFDGLPAVPLFGMVPESTWWMWGLAAVYLVWMLNLYNFMDGIDGIAGIEALTVLAGGALLAFCLGQSFLFAVCCLLAAAVLGFLYWNLPPARIFMGDGGSGFLGLMLGALSLFAGLMQPQLLWSWLILLGVFVVDASFTLARRLLTGMRVFEAHRTHAYQYAARRFGAHLPVTAAVAVINLVWLLPLALVVALEKLDGVLGLLMAYLPILIVVARLGAGRAERSPV